MGIIIKNKVMFIDIKFIVFDTSPYSKKYLKIIPIIEKQNVNINTLKPLLLSKTQAKNVPIIPYPIATVKYFS